MEWANFNADTEAWAEFLYRFYKVPKGILKKSRVHKQVTNSTSIIAHPLSIKNNFTLFRDEDFRSLTDISALSDYVE